jgi:Hsp20/alpha crystallin family
MYVKFTVTAAIPYTECPFGRYGIDGQLYTKSTSGGKELQLNSRRVHRRADRENEIIVRAELPGVSKDNLDVSLSDNTVLLRASTRHEAQEETGGYPSA